MPAMQTLKSYIAEVAPDRKDKEWAALLGTSPSYLSQILSGKRRPGPKLIKAINTMTDGKVPPNVWYLPPPPAGDAA